MKEQTIFIEALEIADPNERADYLDQVCAGDLSLRKQVEALIAAHERSGEFLDEPALKQLADEQEDSNAIGGTRDQSQDSLEDIDLSFLQPSPEPGSLGRLRHYEVREVIGQGGCGIVLKSFDKKLERIVALKIMAPELATTSPARKRFLREARSAAAIRHENVVSIYAVEEQPLPFLVMEYLEGETLQQRLDRTGPIDVKAVLCIGHQISSGLAAAHSKGLIHRDIKPSNILLEEGTDHLKITDFGLARSADDASMTQSGLIAGTPLYMSPEQAQALDIDQRSDLFSLGSVLYVMCSGRPPFRAASTLAVMKRVVEDQPRPIRGIIPEVPEWLVAIIAKLHAKNPAERFASAQEVSNLMAQCLSELGQHGCVEALPDVLSLGQQPVNAAQSFGLGEFPTSVYEPVSTRSSQPVLKCVSNWAAAAGIFLVLLVGLGITEATGVTNVRGTVIRLFSPDGTLVVEVDDPGVSVTIDGEEMVISGTGAKEIRLNPGQYEVLASKDGKVVSQELVTVTKNGRQVVRVSRETIQTLGNIETAKLAPVGSADAVRQELRRRNPGFQGVIAFDLHEGRIIGCKIAGGRAPDLAPLLGLDELQKLDYEALDPMRDAPVLREIASLETINGYSGATYRLAYSANKPTGGIDAEWLEAVGALPVETRAEVVIKKLKELNPNSRGRMTRQIEEGRVTSLSIDDADSLTDLSPLRAFRHLQKLTISSKPGTSWLTDLAPLTDLALTELHLVYVQIDDLTLLKHLPLKVLVLTGTPVEDLSPLQDLPLQELSCSHTPLKDLSPLRGMQLTRLSCGKSSVSDLSPLKELPLTVLNCSMTPVSDLSPLKDLRLTSLDCTMTRVADLAPLKGMPLEFLGCGHNTRISDLSPLQGMPLKDLWCPRTNVKDLSPLKGMPMAKLFIGGTRVSDLSPLKGISLTSMDCYSTPVSDLSPLEGMQLTYLKCPDTRVSDLSPLQGMPLRELWIPEVSLENLKFARDIKSLKSINGKPAATFWKEVDAR